MNQQKQNKQNDIAVIGIAGQFPGASSIDEFWENLCAGKNGITTLSDEELRERGVDDKSLNDPRYVKASPLLDGHDLFDAAFFNYSPREAEAMDPQHRRFLQCVWAALEDAGYGPGEHAGEISLFAGSGGSVSSYLLDYLDTYPETRGLTAGYQHLGNDKDFLATRVAYKLDLKGPAITVQTACSTSLVAVHLACQSLFEGECEMVIAGASNIRVPHKIGYFCKEGHIYSTSGQCRSFDANADGVIFGSAVAAVLLKPLDNAIDNNDPIYAVIKGSAINNDGGNKLSYTASSAKGQISCIDKAIKKSGVDPESIGYVEAHGTGTAMGDPVEINALTNAFRKHTDKKQYCAVASVKSNIGHVEAASGITGFIKLALALKHQKIPPSINFTEPNKKINFTDSPFYVVDKLQPWESNETPRYGAVNSLGVGGTNAFVILEEYVNSKCSANDDSNIQNPYYLITLSAKTKNSLRKKQEDLVIWLDDQINNTPPPLVAISVTMNRGRSHFDEFRCAVVASEIHELLAILRRALEDDCPDCFFDGYTSGNDSLSESNQTLEDIYDEILNYSGQEKNGNSSYQSTLGKLAKFYIQGHDLDWERLHHNDSTARISMPTYPFDEQQFWVPESSDCPDNLTSKNNPIPDYRKLHPLINRNDSTFASVQFTTTIDGSEFFLEDHKLNKQKVLPGVAYLEIARMATLLAGEKSILSIKEITWPQPLIVNNSSVTFHTHLSLNDNSIDYQISTHPTETGKLIHCQGVVETGLQEQALPDFSIDSEFKKNPDTKTVNQAEFYTWLKNKGLNYGDTFKSVQNVFCNEDELFAVLSLPESLGKEESDEFYLHPSLFDGVFQTAALLEVKEGTSNNPLEGYSAAAYLPFALKKTTIYGPLDNECQAYIKRKQSKETSTHDSIYCDIFVSNSHSKLVLSLEGYFARPVRLTDDVSSVPSSIKGIGSLPLPNEQLTGSNNQENESLKELVNHKTQNQSERLQKRLEDDFRQVVAEVTKYPVNDITLDLTIGDFGLDSMMLIELADILNNKYNTDLTPAVFFENYSLGQFCKYLTDNYIDLLITHYGYDSVGDDDQDMGEEGKSSDTPLVKMQSISHCDSNDASIEVNESTQNPIAIIGMAGKMPGADNLDAFWDVLNSGHDVISEVPGERWNWQDYSGDAKSNTNKTNCQWGGFISSIDGFDAPFFEFSQLEASMTDPQQRLLLQTVWTLIEDAGYSAHQLHGSQTGVFMGASTMDYYELLAESGTDASAYFATGNLHSMLANRLSYYFDWHGPSEVIDTACSSSLIAIHRAIKAIQSGQCSIAVAGGVNALLSPRLFASFSKAGMLSPDGRCKTFDKSADGYVRGEGVGAILLKPLNEALNDSDHIYGIIKGSAENHGGRATSLTAPNPGAQTDVLLQAYLEANIDPETVSYIEAHGTGTALGDPIEINALKSAFSTLHTQWDHNETKSGYCGIGSIKTNIGHLEAAAGIAGIFKVLKSMEHERIPASLHYTHLNPYIDFSESPFYVVNKSQEWQRFQDSQGREIPLRAGISSFGFGGVNAHIVIEEYIGEFPVKSDQSSVNSDQLSVNSKQSSVNGNQSSVNGDQISVNSVEDPSDMSDQSDQSYLIVLSAKSENALQQRVHDLIQWLETHQSPPPSLANISYTLNVGRVHFAKRTAFVADSLESLSDQLRQFNIDSLSKKKIFTGKQELQDLLDELGNIGSEITNSIRESLIDKLLLLADYYCSGRDFEWTALFAGEQPKRLSLPTYPFEMQPYWFDKNSNKSFRPGPSLIKNLKSKQVQSAIFDKDTLVSEISLSEESFPFLSDHCFTNITIVSASTLACMLLACSEEMDYHSVAINKVSFQKPFILTENSTYTVQIILKNTENKKYSFQIAHQQQTNCLNNTEWAIPFTGELERFETNDLSSQTYSIKDIEARCEHDLDSASFYQAQSNRGLDLGPSHQWIQWIRYGNNESIAKLTCPFAINESEAYSFSFHPTGLDSILQSTGVLLPTSTGETSHFILAGWTSFRIYNKWPADPYVYCSLREGSEEQRSVTTDIFLLDESGIVIAEFSEVRLVKTESTSLGDLSHDINRWNYHLEWDEHAHSVALEKSTNETPQAKCWGIKPTGGIKPEQQGTWIIVSDQKDMGSGIGQHLKNMGASFHQITFSPENIESCENNVLRLNPATPENWQDQITTALSSSAKIAGLIYLTARDNMALRNLNAETLMGDQEPLCGRLLSVIKAIKKVTMPIWIITRGAVSTGNESQISLSQSTLWGMGRTLAMERLQSSCSLIDLDPAANDNASDCYKICQEVLAENNESQVLYRNNKRYVARLRPAPLDPQKKLPVESDLNHYQFQVDKLGDLTSVHAVDCQVSVPAANEITVNIHYSGLSYRDWLSVQGQFSDHSIPLGDEGVGIVTAKGKDVTDIEVGDTVMVFSPGCLASHVIVQSSYVSKIPTEIKPERCATIPLAFITAYYSLVEVAKIQENDKILIHSAAGGVGLAAVQIAMAFKAEVYTTVSSPEKRHILEQRGVKAIYHSRSGEFYQEMKTALGESAGLDIVLNSLVAENASKSMELLKPSGCFLDLTKSSLSSKSEDATSTRNIDIDLYQVKDEQPSLIQDIFAKLLDGFNQDIFKPLPFRTYPKDQLQTALSIFSSGQQIGKQIVDHNPSPNNNVINADSSYIVVGAFGELSTHFITWLADEGALCLHLVDYAAPKPDNLSFIEKLKTRGLSITFHQVDITDLKQVQSMIEEASQEPQPIKGIFHCAARIDDDSIENLTWDRFPHILESKVAGSWNLHLCSLELNLDHFVLFSSAAGLLGSANQANYAAGNTFQDTLAHYRKKQFLPALSINWAPWSVGIGAAMGETANKLWEAWGTKLLYPDRDLPILKDLLRSDEPQIAVLPTDWQKFQSQFESPLSFLKELGTTDQFNPSQTPAKTTAFLKNIIDMDSKQRQSHITHYLSDLTATLLGIAIKDVAVDMTFDELGLDSLKAIEFRDQLQADFGRDFPVVIVYNHPTVLQLAEFLIASIQETEPDDTPDNDESQKTAINHSNSDTNESEYDSLSTIEVEALILKELEDI